MIAAAELRSVPFKQVIQSLKRSRLPSLFEIREYLSSYRQCCQAAVILKELDPDEFAQAARRRPDPDEWIENPVVNACVNAINNVAPLDMDGMSNRFEGGDHIDELYPAGLGFPMGWEEWEEMTNDLENRGMVWSLYVFVTAMGFEEEDTLINASEYYGWELENEESPIVHNPDWTRLFELLDQHDLSCFKNAINACLYSTDNPYFDYNPWDENQMYDLPEFTLEGVHELMDFWEEAQPINKDLILAQQKFTTDLSLAGVLVKLYAEASDNQKPRQPQTLAEMWAGEDAGQVVVDPFYGPIGAINPDDYDEGVYDDDDD